MATMLASFVLAAPAAAPELKPEDLPRVPPVQKSNYAEVFQLKKGFELPLAAAEPLTQDPIDISFDENGRLFVVEMLDSSELREVNPHLGQMAVRTFVPTGALVQT